MIRAILAADEAWGIGKNGTLPWPRNPVDLRWFKECTLGHLVVMGRNTWESLPKKPLPGRKNLVITSQRMGRMVSTCYLQWFKDNHRYLEGSEDIWIIGGAQLILGTLDIIDEIWLSNIQGTYDCDTFLPMDVISKRFVEHSKTFNRDGLETTTFIRR